MTFFEADFKIAHDCPHVELSKRYPSIKIYVWCNFRNEIVEIVVGNCEDYGQVLHEASLIGDVVSQSSNEHDVHLLMKRCGCTIKNSAAMNAEASDVLSLNPIVISRGWESHRIVAFKHENLVQFMELLDENGFTYELERKTPIHGQLSSSLTLNADSLFSDLTVKQVEALLTAFKHGYFVFPRRMNLQSIARKEKVVRTTLSEHLKKAQNKLFSSLIPYLYIYHEKVG